MMVLFFCTRIKQLVDKQHFDFFLSRLSCRKMFKLCDHKILRILCQWLVLGGQPAIPNFCGKAACLSSVLLKSKYHYSKTLFLFET